VSWTQFYAESYKEIIKNIKKIQGIAVGFNTNLDAIIEFNGKMILELIKHLKIDSFSLYKKIIEWKGRIKEPIDFVTGLCGCFEKGKASEWLIDNQETYKFLLDNLPTPKSISLGGQTGIMSDVLTNLGVSKVIVHTVTLSNALKTRFNKSKNLVLPIYNKKNNLTLVHPSKAKGLDESLHLHIISEVKKGDTLKIDDTMNWRCPRDNRFIATFDPANTELQLMKAFQKDIEIIAQQIDGLFLSGFHMLDPVTLTNEDVIEKITNILAIIDRAKKENPELIVHLEACSTKDEFILEELYKQSMKGKYWDSIGCNERELVEILRAIGEKRFGNELRKDFTQEKVISGCIKICEKLDLQRFHLHQFGSYVLVVKDDYLDIEQLKKSLCFASFVAAEKALLGKVSKKLDYNLLLNEIMLDKNISKSFNEASHALANLTNTSLDNIKQKGVSKFAGFNIIIIPSIVIDKPIYTVGLGDTISTATLTAEISYKKLK
jgi:ADP-dependent phosphofructokinase/glucokinase